MQEPTRLNFGEGRCRWSSMSESGSIGPAGVMATACRHRRPNVTREAPAVIADRINWQLARDRPGRALADVHDSSGFEPHESCEGCVGSNGVIRKHDLSHCTSSAVEGPVAFHRHNAVHYNEMDGNSGAQIEDALLNALPVENILWPSVSRARHYAKQVLHAERDARPVMGLDLGH